MTDQPTPTHHWTWTGSRDLPNWLTGHHHWHDDQLVIHTPDRYVHPEPGWWLIGWSDGTVTAASPTSGERVYGADGIADRLARAETATDGELRRQLDAAIAALGRSETELAQLRTALNTPPADDTQPTRHVHVTIRHADPGTADRAALSLARWIGDQFPAHHVTTDAREWNDTAPQKEQP